MNIHNLFSVPIYINKINNVNEVQTEISNVLPNITFSKNPEWNTHRLSDITFTENILDKLNLTQFKAALFENVVGYLIGINSPLVNQLSKGDSLYKIQGSWFTQTYQNEYAHVHNHNGADISGCYYFKTNTKDGRIFFTAPSKIIGTSNVFSHLDTRVFVEPEVGKIILFPSCIDHGVETNITDNERVSLAFNLKF